MDSHEINYQILGHDMQIVEVELGPAETVIAEAGAMNYMERGISFKTMMGDGSSASQGLMNKMVIVSKRVLTGESLFMTHFTNETACDKKTVAFAAPYPGKILPIHLNTCGNQLFCQKDAFLCAAKGTTIDIALNRRFGVGFFGGEGFILQKLIGDGLAFIHAGGTVVQKTLNEETLYVDTGCLVAFTEGINYEIEKAGNLKSMLFGGEGLFLVRLSGQGTVYLQSLPFSRLADRIIASAPSHGGSATGEGSLFGRFGRFVGGS